MEARFFTGGAQALRRRRPATAGSRPIRALALALGFSWVVARGAAAAPPLGVVVSPVGEGGAQAATQALSALADGSEVPALVPMALPKLSARGCGARSWARHPLPSVAARGPWCVAQVRVGRAPPLLAVGRPGQTGVLLVPGSVAIDVERGESGFQVTQRVRAPVAAHPALQSALAAWAARPDREVVR